MAPVRLEKRTSSRPSLRIAASATAASGARVVGYAATFDTVTRIGDFDEVIRSGAFANTLRERAINVCALVNHDSNLVLGRTTSGTLRLREDSRGLAFTVDLPDTQPARDLRTLMQRGDMSECSFAFSVRPEGERITRRDGRIFRELIDLDVYDVSIVTMPAYGGTSATLASARNSTHSTDHLRAWLTIRDFDFYRVRSGRVESLARDLASACGTCARELRERSLRRLRDITIAIPTVTA